MSFISYAQNFEDIMLWRALKDIDNGFYIDVGAWSPDFDSVTKAFYNRGWQGLNLEPNPLFWRDLQHRRPRDCNLRIAIGDHVGVAKMNFIEDTGLSTIDEKIAERHSSNGYLITSEDVTLTTLEKLWEQYIPDKQEVHFIKIDVEGSEASVIRGNDWSKNRPWIVVIESMIPLSQIESHKEWEFVLLKANYKLIYIDGLNRFYLAKEHSELEAAFKYPPNLFDNFKLPSKSYFVEQFPEEFELKGLRALNHKIFTFFMGVIAVKNYLKASVVRMSDKFINFFFNKKESLKSRLKQLKSCQKKELRSEIIYSSTGPLPTLENPTSQLCTSNQIYSRIYLRWMYEMKDLPRLHRKEWEWVFILEVLSQQGMFSNGKLGLGFGCGLEPLPLVITKYGPSLIVTDMDENNAAEVGWVKTGQHVKNVESIYEARPSINPSKEDFMRSCEFRPVDMNDIPKDLINFDFVWSSCAFEHLGSIKNGIDFVVNSTKCLKPGGIAIHTTEFNLSSNEETFETPVLSLFRKKDIEFLERELEKVGCNMAPLNLNPGDDFPDKYIDLPPYKQDVHLRLAIDGFVATSIGIIVRKI